MGIPDLPLELIPPIIDHLDPRVRLDRSTLVAASRVSPGFRFSCQKRLFCDILLIDRSAVILAEGIAAALLRSFKAQPCLLSLLRTVQVTEQNIGWTRWDKTLPALLQLLSRQSLLGYGVTLKAGTWRHQAPLSTWQAGLVAPIGCPSLVWVQVEHVFLSDFTPRSPHLRSISIRDASPWSDRIAVPGRSPPLVSVPVQLESLSVDLCSVQFRMLLVRGKP